MKAYTDLEQSKKLAEILSLESADMHYPMIYNKGIDGGGKNISDFPSIIKPIGIEDMPCWSLAALIYILNFPSLTQEKEDEWEVCVFDHDNENYIEATGSNPVDACYEMILKLNELNLL